MCCFSMPVPYVAGTKIFARSLEDGRQALVYQMAFIAEEELAMILPLPVPPGSPDDAVRFIDLAQYDTFFTDLERAFPAELMVSRGYGAPLSMIQSKPKLIVHDVGEYEASFVPSIADFDRLDDRFKLAPETWAQLPRYADWGFAVFKLRPVETQKKGFFARLFGRKGRPGPRSVHPMAFEFPRREPDIVFFPTVHIHDGEVHETATFDHQLYCQPGAALEESIRWEPSDGPLEKWMKVSRAEGLIDPSARVFRRTLNSIHRNEDQEVGRPVPPYTGPGPVPGPPA